ncbi:hypothetical protein CRM22_007072 [Opisthorchis felineus]|uniref:G-protein coupled receptors family 1 profile domain-containing protein n=1 Tax=Opisthorchis felineus TaxID=147828 RepID=A0A4V3SE48_OPIFE|nr:hypothetical protein CRM22_007072 [Opisthorchis felineus]
MQNPTRNVPFNPREFQEACDTLTQAANPEDRAICNFFTVIGWTCAYILPVVCGLGLLGTTIIIIIIASKPQHFTRQLIYLICMLISGLLCNIMITWVRLFPSRGLPYATNGSAYFYVRQISALSCTLVSVTSNLFFGMYSNFLVVASLDRFVAIFFPVQSMILQNRHAWIAVGSAALFTLITILPTSMSITWTNLGSQRACWYPKGHTASLVTNKLFSFILPPFVILTLNVLFYGRIRIVYGRRGKVGTNSTEFQQLRASLTLFLLSMFYVIFTIPGTIFIFTSLANIKKYPKQKYGSQISRGTVYLLWEVFFLRELANIFVIIFQVPIVRSTVQRLLCRQHRYFAQLWQTMKRTTEKEINSSKNEETGEKVGAC